MNRKYKQMKQTKRTIKRRKGSILKRPQFSKHPIPRKKRIKRFRRTTPPVGVDATEEVLVGSAAAGSAGTLIGAGSTTVRTLTHMGILGLKKIREKTEETRKTEKENAKTQGGSH